LTPRRAYLERETGLEVNEVSLSSLMQYQQGVYALDVLHSHAEKMVVAAGLCVDFFKKGRIEYNLLPSVYFVRQQAWNVFKIGIVLLLIMAGFMYYQFKDLESKESTVSAELQRVQAEEAKWRGDADKFDQVKSEISTKKPKFSQIFALVKAQIMWPAIMEELGNMIPDTCYIDEIDFEAATKEIVMKGVAVDRIDIMQFAIALDYSDFFTQTTVDESVESLSSGSGGGGIGAGGGGGASGMGITTGAHNPYGPGSPASHNKGRGVLSQRGRVWNSREALGNSDFVNSMPADFELPRLGIRAGRSIQDYFESREMFVGSYKFEFDITTKLQDKALVQEEAVSGLSVLEEVTKDVLNT